MVFNMTSTTGKEPVYIIIPVHNRKQITLRCLTHLAKTGDLSRYYVVIIDDGSTDGTAEAIRSAYPEVIILSGNGDLWWTGATALGMTYAFEQNAEYFIWLNDDCLPDPGTLPGMINFMRSHPNTLVAPSCYYIESDGTKVQHDNGFRRGKGYAALPDETVAVEGLSGWCVGLPVTVFRKIGAPDFKRFPHYSGDDTYTFRATRAGFDAILVGELRAHLVGGVHENLGLQRYFKPGLNAINIFQAIFWNKKSPYRLPTRFFYQIERYGVLFGVPLFSIKLSSWLGQWVWLQLTYKRS
jgi:GT2 family glycosyltransferase